MANNQKPLVLHRKIVKQGNSYYISIPIDWLESHRINPESAELLIVADQDILIVNPRREKDVYEEVTKLVREGKYKEVK